MTRFDPPVTYGFDLPNPRPVSAAWTVLLALAIVAQLKGHDAPLTLFALPFVTSVLLDRGNAGKLVLPSLLLLLSCAVATFSGALAWRTCAAVYGLAAAAVLAWGFANPTTTVGHIARSLVSIAVTAASRERAFPDSAAGLTKDFLERVLGYKLAKFSAKPLGGGFIGTTLRVTLHPASDPNREQTVIAKMTPPALAQKLRMRMGANVFVKEAAFYLHVAPAMRAAGCLLKVPDALRVFYGPASGSSLILMRDESAALAPGDEERPASWEAACSVARRYASFHRLTAQPSLAQLDAVSGTGWLATFDWMSKPALIVAPLLRAAFDEVLEDDALRAAVPLAVQRVVGRFVRHLPALVAHLEATRAFAIVHGDARVENMLFPKASRAPHTRAADNLACDATAFDAEPWLSLDWQTLTKCLPAYDLAYFVTLDLDVDDARASADVDRRLVALYCRELGRDWYGEEAAMQDYRLGCLFASMIPFVVMSARSLGEQKTDRARVVRLAMLRRACRTLLRVDAGAALDAALDEAAPHPPRALQTAARPVRNAHGATDLAPRDDAFSHHTPASIRALPASARPGAGRRDAYDRWWLNAQAPDASACFAVACGFYPGRGVVDAAFCFSAAGVQRNIRESRRSVDGDYGATESAVGSIRVTVVDALVRGRVSVDCAACRAELEFTGRLPARKEPAFDMDVGAAVGEFHYERLTQLVEWTGALAFEGGPVVDVGGWLGVRDRSWGRRPHTAADKTPAANASRTRLLSAAPVRAVAGALLALRPSACPQFYWLWCPTNFEGGGGLLLHSQESRLGAQTNAGAHLFLADGSELALATVQLSATYREGTRHLRTCDVVCEAADGSRLRLEYRPVNTLFMSGAGYNADEFCHGRAFAAGAAHRQDVMLAEAVDRNSPLAWHIQEACTVAGRWLDGPLADRAPVTGTGVLEQLVIGPHAPSGFTRLYDVA